MASKVKITVSVDAGLIRELGGASRKKGKPRSQLVEEIKIYPVTVPLMRGEGGLKRSSMIISPRS
jgi:hypothetical protein